MYRRISLLLMAVKRFFGILADSFSDWLMNYKIMSRFQAGLLKIRQAETELSHNNFIVKLQ